MISYDYDLHVYTTFERHWYQYMVTHDASIKHTGAYSLHWFVDHLV